MLKVNTDVPMPAKPSAAGRAVAPKYPWGELQVCNSFYVQGKNEGKTKRYLITLLSKMGKKFHKKFQLDEVDTGFNVFCVATGLGTADAKKWDYEKCTVISFDDTPVAKPTVSDETKSETSDDPDVE